MKSRAIVCAPILVTALAIGRASWAQQAGGSAPSPQGMVRITPTEIELYRNGKTLIDWTPQQIAANPVLHKLRLAGDQAELPAILDRLGKNSLALANDFPRISCDEEVFSQSTLRGPMVPHGGMHSNDAVHHFRYIIIPKPVGDTPAFYEYRSDADGKPIEIAKLASLGMFAANFAGSWMYFNPSEQPGSRFHYFGTQSVQKRECFVVGFAQKPDVARIITGFRIVDPPAALLVQGLAWIDQQSFQILKIETGLLAPRSDIGLDVENTVVNYSPVQPNGIDRVLWVPHDVTVAVVFRGVFFQNKHHYSNFKFFRAESTIKPAN